MKWQVVDIADTDCILGEATVSRYPDGSFFGASGKGQDASGGIGEMEGVYIVLAIVVYLYICSRQPNVSQRCHWMRRSIVVHMLDFTYTWKSPLKTCADFQL